MYVEHTKISCIHSSHKNLTHFHKKLLIIVRKEYNKRGIIMELFTSVGDIIIFIAAILGAIAGIWKFCSNLGKGVKGKVDENKA